MRKFKARNTYKQSKDELILRNRDWIIVNIAFVIVAFAIIFAANNIEF